MKDTMIPGYASPAATSSAAERFPGPMVNPLGSTGLTVSAAGFGCYRVASGVAAHARALEQALTKGINIIDTSANYADGGSEMLVGEVLHKVIQAGSISRDQVVVISKGGYLQGSNYRLSQERKNAGRPFQELVDYAEGLEHCIHPGFLEDQIGRSLDRLGLETLDGYLLHNPEYFLSWAHQQKMDRKWVQEEYYRRIDQAFRHLETEVANGRIRFYGVSSNTFGESSDDPEFTELTRIWNIAESIDKAHHFKVIQLPLNLLESGAAVAKNQPEARTVLDVARDKQLGVLTNRPLNAFTNKRMVRLASIQIRSRMDYREIITRIKALAQSETRLWRKILPNIATIPGGIKVRIKQQGCFAESLKHHWRSFGSFERWREAKDGIFLPRIQGVFDFLRPLADDHPELADWIPSHQHALDQAFDAVASIYADAAVALEKKILTMIARADDDWSQPGTLSRKAIRALVSTAGVTTVLVGMRKATYVDEVVHELSRPVEAKTRVESWQRLRAASAALFPDQGK